VDQHFKAFKPLVKALREQASIMKKIRSWFKIYQQLGLRDGLLKIAELLVTAF